MKKIGLMLFAGLLSLALGGCAAYEKSRIVDRPAKPIKELVIVVEKPAPSNQSRAGKGPDQQPFIDKYDRELNAALRRDMVRVMADNGIHATLIFIPALRSSASLENGGLPFIDQTASPHNVLWIRHAKGTMTCRAGDCNAFFQTEARLFETFPARMLWSAEEGGSTFHGSKSWEDGTMYHFLLARLNADGMIALPKSAPIVKTEG